MIRSMQRRLTAVLLLFLMLLFACISTANYLSVRSNLDRSSQELMRQLLQSTALPNIPGASQSFSVPYFTVQVNRNGQAFVLQGGQFDLSDRTALQAIITAALAAEEDIGYLEDYRLNFARRVAWDGWHIVCADDSLRQNTLNQQLRSSLMLGAVLLPLFWLLSWLTARRPKA